MNLTPAQHIDFFLQQARTELEQKAKQAVIEAMVPAVSVPITQGVWMMELRGADPAKFNMALNVAVGFKVEVKFEEKKCK